MKSYIVMLRTYTCISPFGFLISSYSKNIPKRAFGDFPFSLAISSDDSKVIRRARDCSNPNVWRSSLWRDFEREEIRTIRVSMEENQPKGKKSM